MIRADCCLCGEPETGEDDDDFFWVRDTRDWPDYKGGPVHRVCANRKMIAQGRAPILPGREERRQVFGWKIAAVIGKPLTWLNRWMVNGTK